MTTSKLVFASYNTSNNLVELGENILGIIGILVNVKPIKKLTKTAKFSGKRRKLHLYWFYASKINYNTLPIIP